MVPRRPVEHGGLRAPLPPPTSAAAGASATDAPSTSAGASTGGSNSCGTSGAVATQAAVAYAAGAESISIDSAVGHELAAGLDGSQCIGEP